MKRNNSYQYKKEEQAHAVVSQKEASSSFFGGSDTFFTKPAVQKKPVAPAAREAGDKESEPENTAQPHITAAAPVNSQTAGNSSPGDTGIQCQCEECEQEDERQKKDSVSIQRKENSAAGNPVPEPVTVTGGPPSAKFIVDDNAQPAPAQMRKSVFLERLKAAVCDAVNKGLTGTPFLADHCPYISASFDRHQGSSPVQMEALIIRHCPGAAAAHSAEEMIEQMRLRVYPAALQWAVNGGNLSGAEQIFNGIESTAGAIAGSVVPGVGSVAGAVAEIVGSAKDTVNAGIDTATGGMGELAAGTGNILFKENAGGTQATQSPGVVMQKLGKGNPIESGAKSNMETAFGSNFSNVEIHTDHHAAQLSGSMNARAFTVGNHIAFAGGEHQPGTLVGDALMAHELAHVMQQEGTGSNSVATGEAGLEAEADETALDVVSLIWNGAKERGEGMRKRKIPGLRSGLSIQRCEGSRSKDEKQKIVFRLADIIGQPDTNEQEIIKIINDLGDDAAELLTKISPFAESQDTGLNQLAGTEAGQRVMARAADALREGNIVAKDKARRIEKILADRKAGIKDTVKPDVQQQIDRLNKAIMADPKFPEYGNVKLPLKFPVEQLQYNMETMGGVYFNPSMPSDIKVGGDAGRTRAFSWQSPNHPTNYPLITIEIGPLALAYTDEYARSVMWHEFQHYQRYLQFREPETTKSEETKQLEAEFMDNSKAKKPSLEIEATSIQLVAGFDKLSDDEMKSVLRYLAGFMAAPDTISIFKTQAIERIRTAVSGDHKKQARLLKLIRNTGIPDAGNLKDLSDAVKHDMEPPPKKVIHK